MTDFRGGNMKNGFIATEAQKNRLEHNRARIVVDEKTSEIFVRSFDSILGRARNINKLFFSFTKKLNRFLPISRAALVIHSQRDKNLKVIALKAESAREGLALSLPSENSLFYRVFNSRSIYTADYPFNFSGNFVERKIMVGPDTKSILVTPLMTGGNIYGLICLASPQEAAFRYYDHSIMERVFRKLGLAVGDLAPLLNI